MRNSFWLSFIYVAILSACGGGSDTPSGGAPSNSAGTSTATSSSKASTGTSTASSKASTGSSVAASSSKVSQKITHNAGKDCMSCHIAGGAAAANGVFTVSGTVYKSNGTAQTNATVRLYAVNTNSVIVSMATDGSGNFYTSQAISQLKVAGGPVTVDGANAVVVGANGGVHTMPGVVTNGACSGCHGAPKGNGKIVAD